MRCIQYPPNGLPVTVYPGGGYGLHEPLAEVAPMAYTFRSP